MCICKFKSVRGIVSSTHVKHLINISLSLLLLLLLLLLLSLVMVITEAYLMTEWLGSMSRV